MPLFYVSTGRGCCIRSARDENHAGEMVLREVGTHEGVQAVRLATEKDLAWVEGMGGKVPKDTYRTKRETQGV